MKDFKKRSGWLFNLVGGPHDGCTYRSGWLLPNGDRIPVDQRLSFPDGERYELRQAAWKSRTAAHNKDDLRVNKDGTAYMEYRWVAR